MNLAVISNNLRQVALNPTVMKLTNPIVKIGHRYGPEILTGVGIVGGVTSTALAIKATLNVEPIITEHKSKIKDINEFQELAQKDGESVNEKDVAHDKTKVFLRTTGQIAKLYAPAAAVGVISITSVLGAHGIMKRRQVALIAAYKALETGFNSYRSRVIAELGEDKDRDFRYGIETEKIKDEETGKTKTVAKFDPNSYSQYAVFFDEGNQNWSGYADQNMLFLKHKQNYYNNLLHARGHVFLNEVYRDLGLEHTREGAVVGWSMKGDGDKYIDFGIFNPKSEKAREFVNGTESAILLDFNVDGVILDYI